MLHILLKGLIIGFSIAAPVGPIGVLCINRSLERGALTGFITGVGAATADGIYGVIAAFGLTFISTFLLDHQHWIRSIGGIFLCYLGVKIFLAKPSEKKIQPAQHNLFLAYATTFFLTITSPMTILCFVAVFAGLGLGSIHVDYSQASFLVGGVVIGSLLWWLILSIGAAALRNKLNQHALRWVNFVSGAIIFLFGLAALISLF
jgi:threonine/homoserine/homoserine lactone efflux protein